VGFGERWDAWGKSDGLRINERIFGKEEPLKGGSKYEVPSEGKLIGKKVSMRRI